jgi:hypothetical protein
MNTPARLGFFAIGPAAVFGAALGAGHLVGPVGAATAPPEAPSVGTYRLYLDFQHDGAVHTAAFTVTADAASHHPTEEGS